MTNQDALVERLQRLPTSKPSPQLSEQIQRLAHARLRSRPIHPLWTFAVAASVVSYLSWALVFTSNLY